MLQRALTSLQVRPVRLTSGLPILVFLVSTMAVPGALGQANSYYCSAYFGAKPGQKENLAFSAFFEAPEGTDINRVRDDYVQFIREKYGDKGANGGCARANSKASEENNMKGAKNIIETGWKPKTFPRKTPR